jgi:hypothetical protein
MSKGRSLKIIKTIHSKKTAELIRWCPWDTNSDGRIREVRKTHAVAAMQENRGRPMTVPLEAPQLYILTKKLQKCYYHTRHQ